MADLSCFATKDNADEGKWFAVKINGTKFPIALKIYGSDSDVVKDYERTRIRKLGIGKNGKTDIDEDTLDELIDSQDEGVIIRIADISSYDWKKKCNVAEDVTIGETVISKTHDSLSYLIDKIPALKDFVLEKSNERSNFLN